MYFLDSQFSDLPMHVTIASTGRTILAFSHADDFASALVWCGQAMRQFDEADQVAIARPTLTEWPGAGKVSMIIPFEGWTRSLDGWHHATQRELQRFFERVPAGPRSLSTEPPPKAQAVNPALIAANDHFASERTQTVPRPDVVSVLREIQLALRQLVDAPPREAEEPRRERAKAG